MFIDHVDGKRTHKLHGHYLYMESQREEARNTDDTYERWQLKGKRELDQGYVKAMKWQEQKRKEFEYVQALPSELKDLFREVTAIKNQYKRELEEFQVIKGRKDNPQDSSEITDLRNQLQALRVEIASLRVEARKSSSWQPQTQLPQKLLNDMQQLISNNNSLIDAVNQLNAQNNHLKGELDQIKANLKSSSPSQSNKSPQPDRSAIDNVNRQIAADFVRRHGK